MDQRNMLGLAVITALGLDATLVLFDPETHPSAIRPRRVTADQRVPLFSHSELGRVILDVLREAKGEPLAGHEIAARVMVMHLSQNDHVVQALAPDGAAHAFDITVLPWGLWRGGAVANSHGSKPPREDLTIRAVVVADEKGWGGVPGKGFGYPTNRDGSISTYGGLFPATSTRFLMG